MANLVAGYNTAGAGASALAEWTSPGNVCAEDGVYAQSTAWTAGAETRKMEATQFGFSIPSNATIVGFRVRIKGKQNSGIADTGNTVKVGLTKDGTALVGSYDTDFAFTTTNTAYERSDGSTETNLFGTTWTPAEVNASTFGVLIVAESDGSATIADQVDVVQVKVFYTLTASVTSGSWKAYPGLAVSPNNKGRY